MRGTAVQFGAGNIGRGFLAQLFHESGLEVVFVDVADAVVEALNAHHAYTIQIVGEGAEAIPITGVRAVHGRDRVRVAEEIAQAEIVCTAVGANALPYIAPALAAGLLARHKSVGTPLNILLCENLHDAAKVLRQAVIEHLAERYREEILAKTGFVQAVVARMVPFQTEADRAADVLAVKVEAYKRLPIDAQAIVGEWQPIVGVEPVSNFEAWVARKLYVHNGAHAVLGYLGHEAGHTYGYDALRDPKIAAVLDAVLDETGRALVACYGFDPKEQAAHVADLKRRFLNESLGDTCRRLARDPIRKLTPDDRLVGAARLCESQGIEPSALAQVIASALRYTDPDDPSAAELQRLLAQIGFDATVQQVAGIAPTEPLASRIRSYWEVPPAQKGVRDDRRE
jgi:mannitol-1-phosphate 5-dehydrogenase